MVDSEASLGKTTLVTGVTGQDGSYLSELLLNEGHNVVGLNRRNSTNNTDRISHLLGHERFTLEECEVSDSGSVYGVIEQYKPGMIFNLAAMSHVGTSFKQPDYTFQVDALGPMHFLEGIRRFSPETKFYQASTSELFGKSYKTDGEAKFQDITTEFLPQSPYAVAKLAAHHMVRIYREAYGVYACAGILFNHESPRRGENFVTRKITKWMADFFVWMQPRLGNVHLGPEHIHGDHGARFPKLRLGNIDAYRDWGHAKDYVRAMYKMMQQNNPQDFVIATGETYSVRDFLNEAFQHIGVSNFEDYIVIDPKFYRPAEVDYLCGDPSPAVLQLNWEREYSFKDLVAEMVWSDINAKKTPSSSSSKVQQEG